MGDGFGEEGATVANLHGSEAGDLGLSGGSDVPESHRNTPGEEAQQIQAGSGSVRHHVSPSGKRGGGDRIPMSKAKRVDVLAVVEAELTTLANEIASLRMSVAAELEIARAEADEDGFPLSAYEAAAREGAIVNEWPEDRAWTEEDERDYLETMREVAR